MKFKNIILISIDALRYDCVSYQSKREINKSLQEKFLHTPTLNKLEKNAICFTKAFSVASCTTPAHASLFTGLYPPDHLIREFFYNGEKLSDKAETLAEYFRKKDFTTIALSDCFFGLKNLDILKGFQYTFEKDINFVKCFKKNKGKKNFVFLHFFDVHEPYLFSPSDVFVDNSDYFSAIKNMALANNMRLDSFWKWKPVETWFKVISRVKNKKKSLLPLYLKGISKFDQGRFNIYYQLLSQHLDMNKTIIVIFSDHGEGENSYGDSNSFGHSGHLANDVIRVPIIIHSPSFPRVIKKEIFSLKDLYYVVKMFSKDLSIDDITSYSNKDRFIYAEHWQWKLDKWPYLKEKKRIKSNYYLFERAIVGNEDKLILSFSPEYFINKINRFSFNRKSIKILFKYVLRWGPFPSTLMRYFYYLFALIPNWGSYILSKKVIAKRNYPIISYSKFNEHMEKEVTIPESKLLASEKEKFRVTELMSKIFVINKKKISRKKILRFLDLI